MNEILIESDGRELQFTGQLIASDNICLSLHDEFSRKFILWLFENQAGGFVSRLQYETTDPHEVSVDLFEEVDCLDDVEKFFYVFEPAELVSPDARIERNKKETRKRTSKLIAQAYETLMFGFLDALWVATKENQGLDRVPGNEADPALRRSSESS